MDTGKTVDCSQTPSKGECPVCFRIPRANIYQCVNGHSICDLCSTKITACPTCRSPGVRIRNRLAESLLDDIKFKCSWSIYGCDKTMLRGEMSTHEENCDKNPHLIKLCSFRGENCQFMFTSTWLTEPENCTKFVNHLKTQHGYHCHENVQIGKNYKTALSWSVVESSVISSSRSVQQYFKPKFYRFRCSDNEKEQLFFRVVLLKADTVGNKIISWALVRLTPETTPLVMKITVSSGVKSSMLSKWGTNCSPVLSWILKPINFKQFIKMIKPSEQDIEADKLFPFSLPVQFLAEYYVSDDGKFNDVSNFETLP